MGFTLVNIFKYKESEIPVSDLEFLEQRVLLSGVDELPGSFTPPPSTYSQILINHKGDTVMSGNIAYGDEYDCWSLRPDMGGNFTFGTQGTADTVIGLYDSNGYLLNADYTGVLFEASITQNLQSGSNYWVVVTGYGSSTGDYYLTVDGAEQPLAGEISVSSSPHAGIVGGYVNPEFDIDFWMVTAPPGVTTVDVGLGLEGSNLDGWMIIESADGTQIAGADAYGIGVNEYLLDVPVDDAATYYISVGGWGDSIGNYELAVDFGPDQSNYLFGGGVNGHPVWIERHDSSIQTVDVDARTWLIVHGNDNSSTTSHIDELAQNIHAATDGDQVLTLDWSSITVELGLGSNNIDQIESHIELVAQWVSDNLMNCGFGGSVLNLIGHSFGANVSGEIAERFSGGVNTIIGIDPAEDIPYIPILSDYGDIYSPNISLDFADNSNWSWSFYSESAEGVPGIIGGNYGNEETPTTADEAIVVFNSTHTDVVRLFSNMLVGVGDPFVINHFSLDRLLGGMPGPWIEDLYDYDGYLTGSGGYEAVITADVSGAIAESIYYQVPDDAYEDNDSLATAFVGLNEQTYLNSIAGNGFQSDDDWYQIEIKQGYERLAALVGFYHEDGNIDLAVYDSSGAIIAASTSGTDSEGIEYLLPGAGTYYLRVYGANLGNMYDLWWDDLPGIAGDLNGSGNTDAGDIDLLFDNFGSPVDDVKFDLNYDGNVDTADADILVQSIIGSMYGDANLDGQVGLLDLDVLGSGFNGVGGWADGDFNGDGSVGLLDLDILGRNWGMGAMGVEGLSGRSAAFDSPDVGGNGIAVDWWQIELEEEVVVLF